MRSYATSAPGKLMIAGEYAVLEGAEALVAAVGRRAYARLGPGAQPAVPLEVAAARAAAERVFGAVPGALTVDVEELRQAGKKLGLGSSAAAAAAAAGVVFAAHGRDVREPSVRELLLQVALEGHRAVAPEGSGADVAASVLGGFVRFRKLGAGVETHALQWPKGLELVVVWTGRPVRTSDMLAAVRALALADPGAYRERMRALAEQAEQLLSALIAADPEAALECFHAYGSAMGELGTRAGIGIIDETTEEIRQLARACRGSAKPSGAGGGDVVLAAFSSQSDVGTFQTRCAGTGFEVLSLDLGVAGERLEEPE
ncbi:MAG: mevalonate kinase [Polyangiales bacterium]